MKSAELPIPKVLVESKQYSSLGLKAGYSFSDISVLPGLSVYRAMLRLRRPRTSENSSSEPLSTIGLEGALQ